MTGKRPVNYQRLFKGLLEAVPMPAFVIDRSLNMIYYNRLAQLSDDLADADKPLTFDQAVRDPAIVQLARESIEFGEARNGLYDRGGPQHLWYVRVIPLAQTKVNASKKSSTYQYFAVMMEDMAEPRLERVQRDFIANISHELRTPLTSVRLMAETLEDVIDTDPDKAQEFVEKIENEVQYLSDLVSELLELSRIESGQLPMTIEPVAAERLVREVMARMLPLAQRHRVSLATDIQNGQVKVPVDSKQIARVLLNLVHNAIKFTPSGGTIIIGTALQADQQVQSFFVRDTGIGINERDLARIFERFYKTDRARSKADHIGPVKGGTGLGLAIARQVVQAHGGRIMAESIVGQGSTFTFTLPLANPHKVSEANTPL